jgi:hypothetical protein
MPDSKLISLFTSLSSSELRDFSSVMNQRKGEPITTLCIHLQQLANEKALSEYDRASAFKYVYGKGPHDDQRMRLLESSLFEVLEAFLIQVYVKNDQTLYGSLKVKLHAERNLPKAFRYAADRLAAHLDSQTGLDRLYSKHDLANVELSFESRHRSRKSPLDFNRVHLSLDTWYCAAKLKHACEAMNARNVLGIEVELKMIQQVRELADSSPYNEEPAVLAYRLVYDSLVNSEDESFTEKMMHFMRHEGQRFPFDEQRELFQYLKNYCIKKLNSGKLEYTRHLFDIYRLNLSNTELLEDEPLSPFEFKNMVTIALRLGELDWVKAFIPSHLNYLQSEQRKNAEIYNLANLHFFMKDYRTTLRLLQQVEFTDVFYALDVRSILLKSYFEQGEEELFNYQASAFKTFLSRNRQVSEYQRTIYRNFIRFAALLMRADGNPDTLSALSAEMEQVKQIADLRWLREKLVDTR